MDDSLAKEGAAGTMGAAMGALFCITASSLSDRLDSHASAQIRQRLSSKSASAAVGLKELQDGRWSAAGPATTTQLCSSDQESTSARRRASSGRRQALQIGLTAEEVEPWQRFPFLQLGYRRGGTHMQCLASMFQWHNETLNAWTMVASTVLGALLLWRGLALAKPQTWWDASPFVAAFIAQAAHFFASAGYHTFMCMSVETAYRWRRVDVCLVITLNIVSNYSLTYYTIGRCGALALTAFACVSGGTGIYNILQMQQGKALDRTGMVMKVAGTALGYYCIVIYRGVAAAVQAAAQAKAAQELLPSAAGSVLPCWLRCPEFATAVAMLLCHGAGATVYAKHWPQRQFPRVFDLCGFSHNLMHIFCFGIYVWGYIYIAILHNKQDAWFGTST